MMYAALNVVVPFRASKYSASMFHFKEFMKILRVTMCNAARTLPGEAFGTALARSEKILSHSPATRCTRYIHIP
jgi:hypothetical protein